MNLAALNDRSILRYIGYLISLICLSFLLITATRLYFAITAESLVTHANDYHLRTSKLITDALYDLASIENILHRTGSTSEMYSSQNPQAELNTYQHILAQNIEEILVLERDSRPSVNAELTGRLVQDWRTYQAETAGLLEANEASTALFFTTKPGLALTLKQLRALHEIAYNDLFEKLRETNAIGKTIMLFTWALVLFVGGYLCMRLIRAIRNMINKRLELESKLVEHQKSLESAIDMRTKELNRAQQISDIGNWYHDYLSNSTHWSDQMFRIHGYPPGGTSDADTILERVHPEDKDMLELALRNAESTLEFNLDYRIVLPNAAEKWVSTNIVTSFDTENRPMRMEGTVQNITERKQIEQHLAEAKKNAEKASRSKDVFLRRMSHELRTPLNGILGFGQLLERSARDSLDEKQQKYVSEIMSSGNHLLSLITDIFDFVNIESESLASDKEPIALQPILLECIARITPKAEERNIRIQAAVSDADVYVVADQARLSQVLLNLLSNAVKFNTESGTIRLYCQMESGCVEICIQDSGKGLTECEQSQLFVPFERLDADKNVIAGTGMGLALSRKLVALMNGKLGVRSSKGKGSTFWLRIPIATLS